MVLAFSIYTSARYFGARKNPGWQSATVARQWVITAVDPGGPAAGRVIPGDRLVAINGDRRVALFGSYPLRDIDPGNTYRLEIDRRGQPLEMNLRLDETPESPLRIVFLVYSFFFFVCGATLALIRVSDGQVRLLGFSLMLVGLSLPSDALLYAGRYVKGWERPAYLFTLCFAGWAFPMAYHFFSRFPTWQSPGPAWRAVQWLLYAVAFLIIWPSWITVHLVNVMHPEPVLDMFVQRPFLYSAAIRVLQGPLFVYLLICLALALVVTARNYRHLREPGSRRRIRWVVAGMVVAFVPWLVLVASFYVGGWISGDTYALLYPLVFLSMLSFPIALAMAVWKDQLFDITVLVRRGLQYLLARNALRTLLTAPFAVLALSVLRNPNRTLVEIVTQGSAGLNLVAIAAIAASLRYRQPLEHWLDRRFFREAYQQEQVLLQLIDELRQQDSMSEISRLVSARVESVLHPATVHVFYRTQERSGMIAGHSSSVALAHEQLPEQHALLGMMGGVRSAQDVPSSVTASLPDHERQWLDTAGVRLIVPIPDRQDRLVGLLLLGERLSDEPYSRTDRRLLEGIAAQIGIIYENQHLLDKVRSDADVRREVLARLDERSVVLLKQCPVCGVCYDSSDSHCTSDGADLVLPLPVERTLDGKYRLDRALGRGGMGLVFEATDLRLQRVVAAKVMLGSLFGDQTALRRFEREARAAARIDHARITRVYDYGAIGSGGAYLIMELIVGRTWRVALEESGVIEPKRAVEWFRQLLDGLRFAHEAGIVHRDLKPENVMIVSTGSGDEELKIMDFGLAKLLDTRAMATESQTLVGSAMGTLGYMAPEALAGGTLDARADIFAIGVMVVESLTGRRPFAGHTPQEIIAALLQGSYHLPGDSPEERALDQVLQRCLTKEPRDRYPSVAALAPDLLSALSNCGSFGRLTAPDTREMPTSHA